jgi:hypothetical protein
MNVRAKFQLAAITDHAGFTSGKTFRFVPHYDTSIPEDKRFMEATPSGSIEMFVTNPAVHETFKNGDFFYVDFTPVAKDDEG